MPRSIMSRGAELLKMARASLFRSQATTIGSRAANQAFPKMANRQMTDPIGSLCKAYKDWQSEHGLYLGDVPELPGHLEDGDLTTHEREWLRAFIQRWNAACDRESASAVAA